MKRTFLILMAALAFCGERSEAQTAVIGTQLEIGPSNSDQVYNSASFYSGAIGQSNNVSATGSLAVGSSNTTTGYQNVVLGYGNNSGDGGTNLITSGSVNVNKGAANAIFGTSNTLSFDPEGASVNNNLVAGYLNYVFGASSCFIAGQNNGASEGTVAAGIIGQGISNSWSYSTVVGSYNAIPSGNLRFVVGNGADSNNRSNALEVYADGTVKIPKPQGDILMGDFD